MTILIPVNNMEDVVELFMQLFSGNSGPRGMDSEALQEWILKFGEDSQKRCTSVDFFVNWMANESPPWASYHAFMSGRLITIDRKTGMRPVGVRETCICPFVMCVMKVTGI